MWPVRLVMSIEVGVAIIIGLGVVPNVFALPVAHWSEWLATIVAAGVGSLSARRMATFERTELARDGGRRAVASH
jgi:hypothetical protein